MRATVENRLHTMADQHPPTDDPFDLVEPTGEFKPQVDRRPRMEEPLPVKLVTVDDATLLTASGLERDLDAFYVGLLGFARANNPADALAYRAENFILHFRVDEPPVRRQTLRALGIEVLSLAATEQKLIEAEIEYTRQKGLMPGQQSIALLDPAGNWLELTESRAV